MADYAPFKRWNVGSTPTRSTNLRPHSLVEERQVLNLLAGVRFSLRPPIFTPSVNMMVLLNMALSVMGRQLAFQAGKYGSSPYRATNFDIRRTTGAGTPPVENCRPNFTDGWRNGSRTGLLNLRPQGRESSTPSSSANFQTVCGRAEQAPVS